MKKKIILFIIVSCLILSTSCGIEDSSSNTTEHSKATAECTCVIECSSVFAKDFGIDTTSLNDGVLFSGSCIFTEGDTVADILIKICDDVGLSIEEETSGDATYVSGINGLAAGDCGSMSGWVYTVNSEVVFYSASDLVVNAGDEIVWSYICE